MPNSSRNKHRLRLLAYAAGFFLALSSAVAAYINSSFIERFVGEGAVGLVFSVGALVSLIASTQALRLVRRFGNQKTVIGLGLGTICSLGLTIALPNSPIAAWGVGAYIIFSFLTAINLDIYLEELSDDRTTGRIRGLFLTASNIAWLMSPSIAGFLTSTYDYSAVYLAAILALIPFLFIVSQYLRDTVSRDRKRISLWSGLDHVFAPQAHNLRRILVIDFLLNFFSSIMVIYMPIYLHEHIGLAWTQIGLIFTIMLIPFVVLDFPLGRIADTWLGEKELLTFGLAMAGTSSLFISGISSATVGIWAGVLLLTRIGSATIESMKETYLFKQIDGRDANIVFISRNMYPLAYLLTPLVASAFLLFFPLPQLFTFAGLVMLLGLPVSLGLKDTR